MVPMNQVHRLKNRRVGVVSDRSLWRILIIASALVASVVVVIPSLDDDQVSFQLPDPKQGRSETAPATSKTNSVHDNLAKDSNAKTANKESKHVRYHTVFSSGCSTFQDWQSYVFFFHLLHSGQEGLVTRIASGCSEEESHTLQQIFDKEIAVMAPDRFRLHLTPDFSQIKTGTSFKYVSGAMTRNDDE